MHGTKKSLVAWMIVAWQFCLRKQGMSAKELQRLMELSCYQTAWSWLQKIRRGATLAESDKCRGTVIINTVPLTVATTRHGHIPEIVYVLELDHFNHPPGNRVRFSLVKQHGTITANTLAKMVEKEADILIHDPQKIPLLMSRHHTPMPCNNEQRSQSEYLFTTMETWLNAVYRRSINIKHLQSYLNEFAFRYNTSSWPDNFTIFDHLVGGLISFSDPKEALP